MTSRSNLLSDAILLFGVVFLGCVSACGPSATPAPVATPKLTTPPPELGSGLVCAAAADRVLKIADRIDLSQFTQGKGKPGSAAIQQALSQYLAGHGDSATRQRAAGLILGQCAAYGFYVTTYQECVGSVTPGRIVAIDTIRACIDRRKWTVYTQQ